MNGWIMEEWIFTRWMEDAIDGSSCTTYKHIVLRAFSSVWPPSPRFLMEGHSSSH